MRCWGKETSISSIIDISGLHSNFKLLATRYVSKLLMVKMNLRRIFLSQLMFKRAYFDRSIHTILIQLCCSVAQNHPLVVMFCASQYRGLSRLECLVNFYIEIHSLSNPCTAVHICFINCVYFLFFRVRRTLYVMFY